MFIKTVMSKESSQHKICNQSFIIFRENIDSKWWSLQGMPEQDFLHDGLTLLLG